MLGRTTILVAALCAFAVHVPACGSQCDRHPAEPPVEFKDGVTDQSAHVYMSSSNANNPWEGQWLDFPPGRTLRFPHHLGGVPRGIQCWFAFSPNPLTDNNGQGATSGFVPGAGNQCTIEANTEEHFDIRNDTCSDVYVMVELSDPILEGGLVTDAGSVSDAATD